MKNHLINLGLQLSLGIKRSFFNILQYEPKKRVFSRASIRHSTKLKRIIALTIGVVLIVSMWAFSPNYNQSQNQSPTVKPQSTNDTVTNNETHDDSSPIPNKQINKVQVPDRLPPSPSPPSQSTTSEARIYQQSIIESAKVLNSTIWKNVAANAWQYFQPGEAGFINETTGLPSAGIGFPYFTDWDLGVYIQAVIDARKIELLKKEGPWGVYDRLEKVLTFLENRKMSDNSLPYWFYQAENGEPNPQYMSANNYAYVADTGRLLVALKNLNTYNNSYATRIDRIINRMNCATMLTEIDTLANSKNIYDYYVASGFAAFWPEKANITTSIINNILSAPKIDLHGVQLPVAKITCEPLLLSVFELPQPHLGVISLLKQVYLAHEAFYNETGHYRAFSEGLATGQFVWEWVVLPDGRTWAVQKGEGLDHPIVPVIFSKVAFSFLALYKTQFARNVAVYLEKSLPPPYIGYYEGISENSESFTDQISVASATVEAIGSNTNGLIISAARHAIVNSAQP